MRRTILQVTASLTVFGLGQQVSAQVLSFTDCTVDDAPSFVAALDNFYNSMGGGPRPTMFLDQWVWNGEDRTTHRVIASHADFDAMVAFQLRAFQTPGTLATFNSLTSVAECTAEGVAITRGTWGNLEGQLNFGAVYGISATDGTAYTEAFTTLAESQADAAPGAIILFENRAGYNDTHIVVVAAETLGELNTYLDSLFAGDDFAEFQNDVMDIRTVTSRYQAVRLQVWAPEQ